jgi:hypothetical protein
LISLLSALALAGVEAFVQVSVHRAALREELFPVSKAVDLMMRAAEAKP